LQLEGDFMDNISLVRKFWQLFDQGKFRQTEALLDCNLSVVWPTSRERYNDRESFLVMNEAFPGVWDFTIERIIESSATQVTCVVYVKSEGFEDSYYANSFIDITAGKISYIETYWATLDKQPDWREKYSECY